MTLIDLLTRPQLSIKYEMSLIQHITKNLSSFLWISQFDNDNERNSVSSGFNRNNYIQNIGSSDFYKCHRIQMNMISCLTKATYKSRLDTLRQEMFKTPAPSDCICKTDFLKHRHCCRQKIMMSIWNCTKKPFAATTFTPCRCHWLQFFG